MNDNDLKTFKKKIDSKLQDYKIPAVLTNIIDKYVGDDINMYKAGDYILKCYCGCLKCLICNGVFFTCQVHCKYVEDTRYRNHKIKCLARNDSICCDRQTFSESDEQYKRRYERVKEAHEERQCAYNTSQNGCRCRICEEYTTFLTSFNRLCGCQKCIYCSTPLSFKRPIDYGFTKQNPSCLICDSKQHSRSNSYNCIQK